MSGDAGLDEKVIFYHRKMTEAKKIGCSNPMSPLILLPPNLTVYQKFCMLIAPLKLQLVP